MSYETDNMEMPCLCDCGAWFDLTDGYAKHHGGGVVICRNCHLKEVAQDEFHEELMDAYCDDNFRTLSWNQPYATLMLHGKIETRKRATNVRGKVLICSCQKPFTWRVLRTIAGLDQHERITKTIPFYDQNPVLGKAIAVADLVGCRPMTKEDEDKCFVAYKPGLFCWIFENVQAIEPFPVTGKQGWGFVTRDVLDRIELIQGEEN